MALRWKRPPTRVLRELLTDAGGDALTYEPVGIVGSPPPGFRIDRWTRELGSTDSDFTAARDALREWQMHRGAGMSVCTDGPPVAGQNVALSAPMPIGYVDVVCRVVAVEDTTDRYGFTYGTLPNHPECGEERFTLTRRVDGRVTMDIVAASRPNHLLAKAFPPIARFIQR